MNRPEQCRPMLAMYVMNIYSRSEGPSPSPTKPLQRIAVEKKEGGSDDCLSSQPNYPTTLKENSQSVCPIPFEEKNDKPPDSATSSI
jgi:hypothetical protein